MEVGTLVYYVPSHDQEYRHIPSIGTIIELKDQSAIIYDSNFQITLEVPLEYIADTTHMIEVVRLLNKVNESWLSLQHLLYRIELAAMNFSSIENIITLIKSVKHYHIN